ncbi:hypothetical protein SALBM135S_10127 [Streptomyces alboniger]
MRRPHIEGGRPCLPNPTGVPFAVATFLKLGRLAFRRRRYAALPWLALLVGAGVAASTAPAPPEDSFSMPGTESQKAFDLLEKRFPDSSADGASARVVIRAPKDEKVTSAEPKAEIEKMIAAIGKGPQVASVDDPYEAKTVTRTAPPRTPPSRTRSPPPS